jgi:hypothetical protein
MLLIWGYRTKVLMLAMVTFLCGQCGNPSAHAVRKAVTKFTLFFIPLFPINIKYTTQCTFCGMTNRMTKEQALSVLPPETGDQPQQAPQPQQPQQAEAYQGQQPYQQYQPQQQLPQHPSQPLPQQQYGQQQPQQQLPQNPYPPQ